MTRENPSLTKKDLEPLATKAELDAAVAVLATKAELKAAVEPLATKAEVKKLAFEIVKNNEKIDKVRDELNIKMDVGFSRVMHAIDSFARKGENYDRSSILHGQSLTEAQVQLKDHERRLAVLKAKS